MRLRAYRTLDNRIDGALLILVDIDHLKRAAQRPARELTGGK